MTERRFAVPSRYGLLKVLRYVRLYGPRRTLVKVRAARHMNRDVEGSKRTRPGEAGYVGIIGCGKFAFSTLAYYLKRDFGSVIRRTMDVVPRRAKSLSKAYGALEGSGDAAQIIEDDRVKLVFIASNHQSHADYAVRCLAAGKSVHVEKPPAVSRAQLERLCAAARGSSGTVTLGFNRPHSRLGRKALAALAAEQGPSAQSWFVAGHRIPDEHWYRNPGEGGRVLGNLCHWIDFSLRAIPDEARLPILIMPASQSGSEIVQVVYTFGDGSTVSLTLSSTGEPFEGVRERFTGQRGDVLVALDDFHEMRIDDGTRRQTIRSLFRDHGHKATVRRSVLAAEGKLAGDDPDEIWRTGILSIWTHEAVQRCQPLIVESWRGTPRPVAATSEEIAP